MLHFVGADIICPQKIWSYCNRGGRVIPAPTRAVSTILRIALRSEVSVPSILMNQDSAGLDLLGQILPYALSGLDVVSIITLAVPLHRPDDGLLMPNT